MKYGMKAEALVVLPDGGLDLLLHNSTLPVTDYLAGVKPLEALDSRYL
jgi:hypothetical protein